MKYLAFLLLFLACTPTNEQAQDISYVQQANITVLGIAQDAGFPQANCKKDCCKPVWNKTLARKRVSCIALVDPGSQQAWIFDATPDFKDQLYFLEQAYPGISLAGIFLSHAHIGHYTGLMHLGREAMGAKQVPVYAMPKMQSFLETNGPWSQLVRLENIQIRPLRSDSTIVLAPGFEVKPMQVPHRDEYSETVGFQIKGPNKQGLFIPDIDKWQKWDRDILKEIREVDYALLDGSFYKNGEIPGRDMSLIPHPFIEESLQIFSPLSDADKSKVHFIHFNHTNPVLRSNSPAYKNILEKKFQIAKEGAQLIL